MWEELHHYETYKPTCQKDAVAYKEKMEWTRIFEFLVGLNVDFELIRVNILSIDRLPSLLDVYAFFLSEESMKNVMQQYSSRIPNRFALVSTLVSHKGGKSGFKKPFRLSTNDKEKISWRLGPIDKDKLKCSHYGKTRHAKENCWDLVGWLEKFSRLGSMQENLVTSYGSDMGMSYVFLKANGHNTATTRESSWRMVTVPEVEIENMQRFMS